MIPLAITIALGGSWARETATTQSDIDLCIICPDNKAKKALLSEIRRVNNHVKRTRLLLDVKVYTCVEFNNVINSPDNLFLVGFFQHSRILFGEDIRLQVSFKERYLRDTVWQAIEEVNEAQDFIQMGINHKLASYKLWTAASTFYYAQAALDEKLSKVNKEALNLLLKQIFAAEYDTIKQDMEKIRWQLLRQESSKTIRVLRKEARKKQRIQDISKYHTILTRLREMGMAIYHSEA